MPKKIAEPDRRIHQVLLRLTAHESDVVGSVAHLHRKTAAAYIYELVQAHVAVVANEPFVQRDLENRRAFEARHSQTIEFSGRARIKDSSVADPLASPAEPDSAARP